MKIKIFSLAICLLAFGWVNFAQAKKTTAAPSPEQVVKNLYVAAKSETTSPFFQTKKRVLVDKYFSKEFADLIWEDGVWVNGEVGVLSFDPLYNAQDTEITVFKIGKPQYGEGNLNLADIPVTFKNMGKAQTILFRLEKIGGRAWKISDIYYPDNEEPNSSLKSTYKYSLTLRNKSEAIPNKRRVQLFV